MDDARWPNEPYTPGQLAHLRRLTDRGDPRPLLYLDVDGVLHPWQEDAAQHYVTVDGPAGPARISRESGAWIGQLLGLFQVVWATAWAEDTWVIERALGVPSLPWLPFLGPRWNTTSPEQEHYKTPAIEDHAAGRPLAWVDDEHTQHTVTWAAMRSATVPTLLVSVDGFTGWNAGHVNRLRRWAAEVS